MKKISTLKTSYKSQNKKYKSATTKNVPSAASGGM